MLKRAWVFVFAIGLAFSATLLHAQEEAQGGSSGTGQEHEPAQILPIPLPVQIIEDDKSTEARERREAESRQREIDDLEAQQGMNLATQAMNEATQSMKKAAWVSTALVGLGTFLLIWTLRLTRQANKAAQEAVEVTRRVGEAQTVAYPSIDALDFELGERLADPYRPIINLRIKNAGNTPAFDVGVNFFLSVRVGKEVRFCGVYPANIERGKIRIDPSMTDTMHCTPDDIAFSQYIEELKAHSLAIYVKVVSSYTDVFGSTVSKDDHFRSTSIYCHANANSTVGEYTFNIKMAKYDPERD
jgi:hypothetical protein